MAATIRMKRQGKKHTPQFQIVVLDREARRDGEYLEKLGYYYPKAVEAKDKIKINAERVKYWQSKGAQISQTVGQLLKHISN